MIPPELDQWNHLESYNHNPKHQSVASLSSLHHRAPSKACRESSIVGSDCSWQFLSFSPTSKKISTENKILCQKALWNTLMNLSVVFEGLLNTKYGSLLVQKSRSARPFPSNKILTIFIIIKKTSNIYSFLGADWLKSGIQTWSW